jgi:hypothetical protein
VYVPNDSTYKSLFLTKWECWNGPKCVWTISHLSILNVLHLFKNLMKMFLTILEEFWNVCPKRFKFNIQWYTVKTPMAATLVALNLHKPTNIITRWPNKSSWLFNSVFIFEITNFYKNHTLILHKNLNHVGLLYKRRPLKIPCL